jgi:hypothetical protein
VEVIIPEIVEVKTKLEIRTTTYDELRTLPLKTNVVLYSEGTYYRAEIAKHDHSKENQGENIQIKCEYGYRLVRPSDKDVHNVYMIIKEEKLNV